MEYPRIVIDSSGNIVGKMRIDCARKPRDGEIEVVHADERQDVTKKALVNVLVKNDVYVTEKINKMILVHKLFDLVNDNPKFGVLEMNSTEIAREIFIDGVEAGLSPDEIKLGFVKDAGLSFTNANKEYKKLALEHGLVLSPKERRERITAALDEVIGSAEEVGVDLFKEAVDAIIGVPGLTEAKAQNAVRKYCKDGSIELDLPKKAPSGSKRARAVKWIIENAATADDAGEEFAAFIESLSCSERQAAGYKELYVFGRACAGK